MTLPEGILVVDKPVGPTSHDIVSQARRVFRTKRIGHAGTLDPAASGVLLLLVGEATKLSAHLTLSSKRYRARIALGRSTTSDDAMGDTLEEREVPPGAVTPARLEAALQTERLRELQLPPTVSAIKSGGVTAHAAARRGTPLELPPRPITVLQLALLDFGPDWLEVELEVSKGYYVRALARDLGETLGYPAHVTSLRRLASGPFRLDEAQSWPPPPGAPPPLAELVAFASRVMPVAELSCDGLRRALLGQRIPIAEIVREKRPSPCEVQVRLLVSATGTAVALAEIAELTELAEQSGEELKVIRGFVQPPSPHSLQTDTEPSTQPRD